MSEYTILKVYETDKVTNKKVNDLLNHEGIRRDGNLDYTCAMFDENYNVIATGSTFGNTLRCMAVSSEHQGEGLMNQIVTHLVEHENSKGNYKLFLYTKTNSAKFFGDLGFYEIVRINNQIVFMENRRDGFKNYLDELEKTKIDGEKIAALVLNANPFTLGHLYLVEKAAGENDYLHLFIVSEDASLVPFEIRKRLVIEGTRHLKNLIYHDSGPYIISSSTFPSYFQKDESAVIESHANLDLEIFIKIAGVLKINSRYVGEEPTSLVTGIYNKIMSQKLPEHGIKCVIVPRKAEAGKIISASNVRQAIKNNELEKIKNLVPESTYKYFTSPEAESVIKKIRSEANVIHY